MAARRRKYTSAARRMPCAAMDDAGWVGGDGLRVTGRYGM